MVVIHYVLYQLGACGYQCSVDVSIIVFRTPYLIIRTKVFHIPYHIAK